MASLAVLSPWSKPKGRFFRCHLSFLCDFFETIFFVTMVPLRLLEALWDSFIFFWCFFLLWVYFIPLRALLTILFFYDPIVTFLRVPPVTFLWNCFWKCCKQLKLLRKAGCLQLIQNLAPSVAQRRQCDIGIVCSVTVL